MQSCPAGHFQGVSLIMRTRMLTLAALTTALAFPVAQAQPTESDLKALGMMYSLTVVGSFNRDWCSSRAPQTKAAVQSGYDGWLRDTKLNLLSQTASAAFGDALKDIRTQLEGTRAQVYAALDKAYPNPAQACQNFRAIMSSEMNPQKLYPAEYAAALKVQVGAATSQPARQSASQPAQTAAAPGNDGKPGGPLKFGTYDCKRIRTSGGLPPRLYSLNIYENGQWRQVIDGKEVTNSVYKYDPRTGKIDISYELNIRNAMFESDADEEFAYFIADKSGAAVIYAEDDYGLGVIKTTCVYAGANKLPSPAQVNANAARAEAAREAEREKERNRYRTAPNAGLKLSQIATIVHDYSSNYDGQNTNEKETDTLLLNDGTAYLNLRWTPHDLDVKASRAGEPNQWTKWRKQGGGYQILKNGQWVKLEGTAMAPFTRNERISGAYSYKSYYQVGWFDNASVSYSESNYYFGQDGTFDRGSLSRTTGGTDMGGIKTSGVVQSSKPSTGGTYSVDGYTIQFKYSDGQIARPYGFFWSGDKKKLVIGGTTYSR